MLKQTLTTTMLAATLATTATTAHAGTIPMNHDDVDVVTLNRWHTGDVRFEVIDTAPAIQRATLVSALNGAFATWNHVGAGPMLTLTTATDGESNPAALDGHNRVGIWSDGAWPYPAEAGAVTLVYAEKDGDRIGEVDIALNPAFAWALDPDQASAKYDLQNVLVHEVGHALGLPDLKDREEASMFYLITRGETLKRDLDEDDEAMLLALYEGLPLDPDTTAQGCNAAGTAPATMFTAVGLVAVLRRRRNVRN